MIVKKSSKKPSRTPEAKEKRFLRQQEKRKKAKETKRLEKSQNETADESKPLDASIAESKTGAVKKRKKHKKKIKDPAGLDYSALSEEEKKKMNLRRKKQRMVRRARRKRSREPADKDGQVEGGTAVKGEAKEGENKGEDDVEKKESIQAQAQAHAQCDDGEDSIIKTKRKKKRNPKKKRESMEKETASSNGPPVKRVKTDTSDGVNGQMTTTDVEVVNDKEQTASSKDVGTKDSKPLTDEEAASIGKKRQRIKALKEKRKIKRKLAKRDKATEDGKKGATDVVKVTSTIQDTKVAAGGQKISEAAAVVEENKNAEVVVNSAERLATAADNAMSKIEKKRQKMLALKERTKLKKKLAKEQKDATEQTEESAEASGSNADEAVVIGDDSITTSHVKPSIADPTFGNKDAELSALVQGLERKLKKPLDATSSVSDPAVVEPVIPEVLETLSSPMEIGHEPSKDSSSTKLTSITPSKSAGLKAKMESKLDGAKFRFINEKLYTMSSQEALDMFEEDRDAFNVYHRGYAQQVAKWPVNPVDVIIDELKATETSKTIVDMGCGEAKLARELSNHGVHHVKSFDLVATNELVTACDMRKCPVEDESVDVVVFCLSLMGTNLVEFVREANRMLKKNGVLKIAEVESRCKDLEQFLRDLQKCGFKLSAKNVDHKVFFLIDLKKTGDCKVSVNFPLALEPCYYKKR